VIYEQIIVERIRMVEIGETAIIDWKIRQVSVLRVLLNENDFTGTDRFKDAIGDRRLPDPVPPQMPIIMLTT
jgi:hypothetical protein